MKLTEYLYNSIKTTINLIAYSAVHHEITQFGGIKTLVINGLSKYIMPFISKNNPNLDISIIEEFVAEVKKGGSVQSIIIREILEKQEKCAKEAGISTDKVGTLAKCMTSITKESDPISKAQSFASCADIDLANIPKVTTFASCIVDDLRETAAELKKIATALSKNIDLDQFSGALAKLEKVQLGQLNIPEKVQKMAESCSHTIGEDSEHTLSKIACLQKAAQTKGGAMNKFQALIKCDGISLDNAFEEAYNSIALAQCIGKTFESEMSSLAVDQTGNIAG